MYTSRTRTARTGWRARRSWLAATAVLTAVTASLLTGTAASAAATGYLALGDSYAAGQGVGGVKGSDVDCLQSPANYPSAVASTLGLTLTDNTCNGAVLDDVFNTSAKGHAPQASAPADSVGLITLTMGGNDLGFSPVLTSCLAQNPQGPLLSGGTTTCKDKYTAGGTDQLLTTLTNVVTPKLKATLSRLTSTYPSARVVMVGYPTLMPETSRTPAGGCFSTLSLLNTSFPFVTSDLEWLNGIQRAMDAQFAAAAEDTGVEYVSQMAKTAGHSSCSAYGTPYIAPVTFYGFQAQPQSFHPNLEGLTFQAQNVRRQLTLNTAFQGIRGQLIPKGDNQFQLQIVVPSTLKDMPDIAAFKNGQYIGNVKGGSAYYLYRHDGAATITYHQTLTVDPADQVVLWSVQDQVRQNLTED